MTYRAVEHQIADSHNQPADQIRAVANDHVRLAAENRSHAVCHVLDHSIGQRRGGFYFHSHNSPRFVVAAPRGRADRL